MKFKSLTAKFAALLCACGFAFSAQADVPVFADEDDEIIGGGGSEPATEVSGSLEDPVAQVTIGGVTTPYGNLHDALEEGKAAGSVVTLLTDVDLTGVAWTPVGTSSSPFSGVFNGNGHTISGLTLSGPVQGTQLGLFGVVRGTENANYTTIGDVWVNGAFVETNVAEAKYTAVVKNLVLANVSVSNSSGDSATRCTGALAGQVKNGYVANIEVSGSVQGVKGVGGVIGSLDNSVVKCCTNSATVVASTYNVGGVAGCANYRESLVASAFIDCANSGAVTKQGTGGYAGGIVGMAQNGTGKCDIITGCSNSGEIHSSTDVSGGGLGGILGQGQAVKIISNCVNSGTITAHGNVEYVGGIAGTANSEVFTSANYANITISADYLCGIYTWYTGQGVGGLVNGCVNEGTLVNTSTSASAQTRKLAADTAVSVWENEVYANVAEVNALIASATGAKAIEFHNCTVTDKSGTLTLNSELYNIISDTQLCTAVDVSTGNASGLTVAVPNVSITGASNYAGTLYIRGVNNIVVVNQGVTVAAIVVSGNGSTVTNNGTVARLELGGTGAVDATNNGTLGKLGFADTGTYTVVNKGTISHTQTSPGSDHTVSTIHASNITIDNYGTIEAKKDANDGCSYALLFYNGSTVVVNCYNGSMISCDKSGLFLACGSANSVTINIEEGASFQNGASTAAPTSYGNVTVQPLVTGYAGEPLPAGPDMSGDVINVTAANAQYTLDGAYGNINGKTINFTESIAAVLELCRATKYEGSGTSYKIGYNTDNLPLPWSEENIATIKAHNGMMTYYRTVSNIVFTANQGVTLQGFAFTNGYHQTGKYDFAREITVNDSGFDDKYVNLTSLNNITFEDLTFNGNVTYSVDVYHRGLESTSVSGITFNGCSFANTSAAAIHMLNDENTAYIDNTVVSNCTFTSVHQGVYVNKPNGATIVDNYFYGTGHNAIAMQSDNNSASRAGGDITIIGNYATGVGDRVVRFNYVGADANITINNNVFLKTAAATASESDVIKGTDIASGATVDLEYTYWNGATTSDAIKGAFTQFLPTNTGINSGTWKVDVSDYVAPGYVATANETNPETWTVALAPANPVVTFQMTDSVGKMLIQGLDDNVHQNVFDTWFDGVNNRPNIRIAFTQTVEPGGTATKPTNTPYYDNNITQPNNGNPKTFTNADSHAYTFDGWATSDGALYDFDTPVTENLTLHPRFSATGATILINNETELRAFAREVELGRKFRAAWSEDQQTVQLAADITLTSAWTPVAGFEGIFDGNSHSISGLVINSTTHDVGFFSGLNCHTVVKDLTFVAPVVSSSASYVGVLAGAASANASTIHPQVSNVNITGAFSVSGQDNVGALIGQVNAGVQIEDCTITGTGATVTAAGSDGRCVGGLLGNTEGAEVSVVDCSVSGVTVTGYRKIGGLIGQVQGRLTCTDVSVSNVTLHTNATTDYANTLTMGGLVGIFPSNYSGSTFTGTVSDLTMTGPEHIAEGKVYIMGLVSGGTGGTVSAAETAMTAANMTFDVTISGTNTTTINTESSYAGINGNPSVTYVASITRGEVTTEYTSAQEALDQVVSGDTLTLYAGDHGTLYIRQNAYVSVGVDVKQQAGEEYGTNDRYRSFAGVTITGQTGATLTNLVIEAGAHYGTKHSNPDYSTTLDSFMEIDNLTISGLTFNLKGGPAIDLASDENLRLTGLKVDGCTVNGTGNFGGAERLLYCTLSSKHLVSRENSPLSGVTKTDVDYTTGLSNLVVKDCTFNNLHQVMEVRNVENLTFTGNDVNDVRNQTIIAVSDSHNPVALKGTVTIANNTIDGTSGDRVFRMDKANATVAITGNTITDYSASDADFIKISTSGNEASYTITGNTITGTTGGLCVNCDKEPGSTDLVAKIGNKYYATLDAAYAAAAEGDTIHLLADITYGTDKVVDVWGKAVNLDLGGFTLETKSEVDINAANAGYKAAAICYSIGGNVVKQVTVSNGTIITAYGAGIYADDPGLELTLSGLTIRAATVGTQATKEYSSAVRITYGSKVIINDGSFTGPNAIAVSNSGGRYEITGGEFVGDLYISDYHSTEHAQEIVISGGYFSTKVPAGYCATGYVPTTRQAANGLYTVTTPATVTYTLAEGAPAGAVLPAPASFTYPSGDLAEIALAVATCTDNGYTFGGWQMTVGDKTKVVSALPAGTKGDVTLVATWKTVKKIEIDIAVPTQQEPTATEKVEIKVTDEWVAANVTVQQGATEAEKVAAITNTLNSTQANNLTGLENYLLGLNGKDPNAKVKVESEQGASETAMPVKNTLAEKVQTADTGFTVKYSLDKVTSSESSATVEDPGEKQDTSDLELNLKEATSGNSNVAYYKMTATITKTVTTGNNETNEVEVSTVQSENTVGVMKVESQSKTTVIGVPWTSLSDDGSISVADIVRTSTLSEGDQIQVYDTVANGYRSWTLDDKGAWVADEVIGGGASTEQAQTVKIDRGKGVLLTRTGDKSKPIYLVGEASTNTVSTTLEKATDSNTPAWNLVASPKVEPVDLADLLKDTETDSVIVPTDSAPRNYTYKDGKWGYSGLSTETITNKLGIIIVRPVRVTGDTQIPAGRGFWYLNKDASDNEKKINW